MPTPLRTSPPWLSGQVLTRSQIPGVFQQAMALHQRGQIQSAQALYDRILKADPSYFLAWQMLGAIAAQAGHFERAVEHLDRALALHDAGAELHMQRGYALQQLGRLEEALNSYNHALDLQPRHAEIFNNKCVVLQALGRWDEAVACGDLALSIKPGFAQAHFNKGNALRSAKRRHEALACYDVAIAALPTYAKAHINRGVVLQELHRPLDALASHERAIALQPYMAEAHLNRGGALHALARLPEAVTSYEQAISLRPDYADAHLFKATAQLLQGQFKEGWASYEWRWKTDDSRARIRSFPAPQWTGAQSLSGKTVLLHSEQGLGDVIQFCRYASLVKDLGAHVVLEVHRPLLALMQELAGVDVCVAVGDALPEFSFHCPLLSLPLAFQTTLDSIPCATSYLRVDSAREAHWRQRLGDQRGLRVGIVWSGNPAHAMDYNRSIALSAWLQHMGGAVEWFSLQQDVRESDAPALAQSTLRHFGAELRDLSDTAALCRLMDVVISVDTSVAHLSAALGCPTWVLLPRVPDWRWLLDRTDSPWYPSVRLYRQTVDGDWSAVLSQAAADLTKLSIKRSTEAL